ncbi:helix-turn-helix transcriptional regulator [Microbacterium sp. UFMG61]|uniref:helix-turn-helix transcriptional regulator n=1 Tax=Microbacterium sp. UFMG61 TaxID=2745935 RepID=UPI00188E9C83|nr:LuxR C-terminal-related transcriptional regulator [Microbacterium sp. UFMG61]
MAYDPNVTVADTATPYPLPEIEQVLLESKTTAAAAPQGLVSRRALIERAGGGPHRVVAITAPAGYGKSTLLAEWAAAEQRVTCWATVDRFDNDPGALLTLLATATQHITPSGASLASKMRGTSTTLLARSAPLLARTWSSAPEPFALFIDDFHLASSPDCLDAFVVALQGIPEGSLVVVASRETQPHLARMRVSGAVADVNALDLRMDQGQAEKIFASATKTAPADIIAAAVERSEGWPAGIFMSALTFNDAAKVAVSGGSGTIADYLYRECLAGLRPELRDFLLDTAILHELTPELCDHIRETNTSHDLLHSALSLGLFLTRLGNREDWYRYHALFREFLIREGERRDRRRMRALHLRAGNWYEAHGVAPQSIEHLIEGGEDARAVNGAARISLTMFQRGEVSTLDRWRNTLGDAVVHSCPPMAVMSAWKSAMFGESPRAENDAAALERIDSTLLTQPMRASFEAGRALVRASLCANGPEDMLRNTEFAVQQAPEGTLWNGPALYLRGEARLLNADLPSAERDFVKAYDASAAHGNSTALLLAVANLTVLAADREDWDRAAELASDSLRILDESAFEGYPTIVLALASAARVAAQRADDQARPLVSRAMRARVQSTHTFPHVAIRARLQLASAFRLLGDEDAAIQLAREGVFLMRRRPRMGVLGRQLEEFLVGRRSADQAATPTVVLTPAEMRLLPYLQTHLTLQEIGKRLFLSRATISTQASSIYRKLGAERRGAAVAAAQGLGLLS